MEEFEKIERLRIMFDNAKALSKADDPLLDHYLPLATVVLSTMLTIKDPQNAEFDSHLIDFE